MALSPETKKTNPSIGVSLLQPLNSRTLDRDRSATRLSLESVTLRRIEDNTQSVSLETLDGFLVNRVSAVGTDIADPGLALVNFCHLTALGTVTLVFRHDPVCCDAIQAAR